MKRHWSWIQPEFVGSVCLENLLMPRLFPFPVLTHEESTYLWAVHRQPPQFHLLLLQLIHNQSHLCHSCTPHIAWVKMCTCRPLWCCSCETVQNGAVSGAKHSANVRCDLKMQSEVVGFFYLSTNLTRVQNSSGRTIGKRTHGILNLNWALFKHDFCSTSAMANS